MSSRLTLTITRRMAAAVALVFAVTSVFSLVAPSSASAWAEGAFSSSSENDLVRLTNQSRASAGRKALRVDSTLHSIARWRSKDMITRDYFSHDIPGYGRVFDVMSDRGFCYHVAGENIGWNNSSDGTATGKIHNSFMGSAGHRSNILGKDWDVIGIGAYKGANGKKMWTVIFADKCGTTKPKPAPKPKPKPTAAPKAKPTQPPKRATPKPTKKPTATPMPTPTPAPIPIAIVPAAAEREEPNFGSGPALAPAADGPPGSAHGLRVLEPGSRPGLLENIVGGVTGFFLGS